MAFNPISEWEEPIEITSLTLFDMHRSPRIVNENTEHRIRLPLKVLKSEFQCPVCLGYMKKTSIVMECLHRFCGECIQKCLRLGKKECPSCRIHIPSRRSLRPDPTFDSIIECIYGNIQDLEQIEEKQIARMNRDHNMNNAYAESRKRGILQQARHRKKRQSHVGKASLSSPRPIPTPPPPPPPPITTANKVVEKKKKNIILMEEPEESTLISFVLTRHPQETLVDRLEREFIRTSGELSVRHLKVFLGKKLTYPVSSHFQILTVVNARGVVLDDDITLADIHNGILAQSNDKLVFVLHYRVVCNRTFL